MMRPSRGDADEISGSSGQQECVAAQAYAPFRLTFSKRLLIVATITLTCLIVVCAAGVTELLISYQHGEFSQRFSAQREALKEEVDKREARIRQLVVTYQIATEYMELSGTHARKIRLPRENEPAQTVPGSAAIPSFSVVSTLNSPENAVRLSKLIDLARYASTFSLSRPDHSRALPQGFIYTPDKRFLATLPPLAHDEVARLNSGRSAENFIENRVAVVEEEMRRSDMNGAQDRVLWVTGARDPVNAMTTTYFATSVYDNEQRKATIVLAIPCNRFNQTFLHNDGDPHFLLSRARCSGCWASMKRTPRKCIGQKSYRERRGYIELRMSDLNASGARGASLLSSESRGHSGWRYTRILGVIFWARSDGICCSLFLLR